MDQYDKGFLDGQEAGWISVEDRLPEYGHNVLFATIDGAVSEGIKVSRGWNGFRWAAVYPDCVVTHWRPMPEPPERSRDHDTD